MSLAPSLTRSSELLTVPLIQEVFDDHDDCDRDDDDDDDDHDHDDCDNVDNGDGDGLGSGGEDKVIVIQRY